MKRKSIGKRQRFNIFKRDEFKCCYCGRTPPAVVLELDHIIPVSQGGTEDDTNLTTSCFDCNRGKADGSLSSVPRPISDALAEQVERREQLEEFNRFLMASRKREQSQTNDLGSYWCDQINPDSEKGKWLPSAQRMASIRVFQKRLTAAEIYESMDIAISRKRPSIHNDESAWKYFCGVCWSKIREREKPE